jgi:hypothetical protein
MKQFVTAHHNLLNQQNLKNYSNSKLEGYWSQPKMKKSRCLIKAKPFLLGRELWSPCQMVITTLPVVLNKNLNTEQINTGLARQNSRTFIRAVNSAG